MTAEQITAQLQPLIGEVHSEHFCYRLVDSWVATGTVPEEVIEPVLRFMEQHTEIDFGLPGPLVNFMERSLKKDPDGGDLYEEALIASIMRKPVPYTLWMVNRILNVVTEPARRHRLIGVLRDARQRSQDDLELLVNIDGYLAHQAGKDR